MVERAYGPILTFDGDDLYPANYSYFQETAVLVELHLIAAS
jgi:hypothetical protein